MRLRLVPALAVMVAVSMVGCESPGAAPLSHFPTVVPASPPSASGGATPSVGSGSAVASPASSALAGFDGWSVIKPFSVDIGVDKGSLVMTLTHQALWFNADRGVLFSRLVDGDFRITATVRAAKTSAPAAPPGGDGTVQLGGLMARADRTPEDYVFIVVGDDGDGPSIETKSTDDSVSTYDGPLWTSTEADLRLCRVGSMFALYKRLPGSSDAWATATTYDRPDLSGTLQVGANIYSGSTPDLTVRYDKLVIERVSTTLDCTA